MHFTTLTAVVVFGNIAPTLGSSHGHEDKQGDVLVIPMMNSNRLLPSDIDARWLEQQALLDEQQASQTPLKPMTVVRRDENQLSHQLLNYNSEAPSHGPDVPPAAPSPTQHVEIQAVEQIYHPITVPQMRSTMAPIEAAQSLRSYQSAQASISSVSEVAAQKGRAGATMAAAASSASASLARTSKGLEKSLVKSCKGSKKCEKFYKDGVKPGNSKHGKQHGGKTHHSDQAHHNEANTSVRYTTAAVALGVVAFAFALI